MSDPTLSDIDFENKMAWVRTTLIFPGTQPIYVPLKKINRYVQTPSWNEIDKWIDDEPGDVEMSGSKKEVKMDEDDEDEDEEEPAGDVKSEFA